MASFVRALASERSPRTGCPLAPNTRAHYASVVRCFLAFLLRRGRLLRSPAAALPLPSRRRLPRAISQTDVRRVLDAPPSSTAVGVRDRAVSSSSTALHTKVDASALAKVLQRCYPRERR